MANIFVDTALGSGNNDGTTTDHAYRGTSAIKTAMELATLTAGDKIWIRRTSAYDEGVVGLNADIALADDGTAAAPIYIIGAPRAEIAITAADFTNGSRVVDNVTVDGGVPSRTKHTGRFCTAPDGEKYLICAVLWEAAMDGVDDLYDVGSKLTNTTQTKYGKVFAYTDLGGNTGTLQYARDSATAWVENDHIHGGTGTNGNGDIAAAGETAVGFIIDREYAGSTVTGANGACTIDEDEDYDTFKAINDAAWTIKVATWADTDADDLPVIDFNDEAYDLIIYSDQWYSIRNIEVKDSLDASGIIQVGSENYAFELIGCLIKQTAQNTSLLYVANSCLVAHRIIIEGSGAGTSQRGVKNDGNTGTLSLNNVSIYNCGDNGFYGSTTGRMNNVNIGTEIANLDTDIVLLYNGGLKGKDVSLGGSNGYVTQAFASNYYCSIENYGKVLGKHKTFFAGGTWESEAVTSTSANKKLSDTILKITPNVSMASALESFHNVIFDGEFQLESGAQTIKFWLYNDTGVQLNDTTAKDNIYLRATYVGSYDDTSEYTMTTAYSTQIDIADAADADDWDYLSVAVNPATASKVRVELLISYYDATGDILIDPQPVIT